MNGDTFPLKDAFGLYMAQWYRGLYGDTKAVQEFIDRGFAHSCQWASGRMVDDAEAMLAAYRKNDNAPQGRNTLLPVVLVGIAKDYTPTGADWGGRQVDRQMVQIVEGGSVYGYRQAMYETRVQVVIIAAEEASAKSLAAQFCWFVGVIRNRRFKAAHQFGQYTVEMPVVIENPDTIFMNVATEQKNMTILAGDLTLKAQIPYFDAPRTGEPNDGTSNNPPGYLMVQQVNVNDMSSLVEAVVIEDNTDWNP